MVEEAKVQLRKSFLIVLIVSLSIAALIAIIFFLIGDFNEYAVRLILTTLILAGYSVVGMASAELYQKRNWQILPIGSLFIYLFGIITATLVVWRIGGSGVGKSAMIFLILSLTAAQMCLLFLIKSEKNYVNIGLGSTSVFASLLAIMLILLIIEPTVARSMAGFYMRLLAVFAILDGLGTVITPIMHKISTS